MTVRDAKRDSRFPGQLEDKPAEMMDMAVNDIVWAPESYRATKVVGEGAGPMRVQARDDPRAERKELFIIGTGPVSADQEVHSKATSVDMSKHVKEPCLDSTSIHAPQDVKYSNGTGHLFPYFHRTSPDFRARALSTMLPINWTVELAIVAQAAPIIPNRGTRARQA